MEYVVEVWWTRGPSACRKLESAQIRVGQEIIGSKKYSSRSNKCKLI